MSATEELRRLLDEQGVEYETNDIMGASETTWSGFTAYQLTPTSKLIMHPTPEQAIAATLGDDAKLCHATEANYRKCKYSTNRGWCDDAPFLVWDDTGHLFITMGGLKTWDVTDDAKRWFVTLGEVSSEVGSEVGSEVCGGKLTAEQVRKAVMSSDRWEKPMGNTGMTNTHLIIRDDGWQAIADELNATLGGGECDAILDKSYYRGIHGYCEGLKCSNCGEPLFSEFKSCPWCGMTIRKAVKHG